MGETTILATKRIKDLDEYTSGLTGYIPIDSNRTGTKKFDASRIALRDEVFGAINSLTSTVNNNTIRLGVLLGRVDALEERVDGALVFKASDTVENISAYDTTKLKPGYMYSCSNDGTIRYYNHGAMKTLAVKEFDEVAWSSTGWYIVGRDRDVDLTPFAKIEDLAAVAFSGAYGDLIGAPTLHTVATSGSYNDLDDKPTGELTIRVNGVGIATFAAGATSDVFANISVPTKTSDLDNDANFTPNAVTKIILNGVEISPVSGVADLGEVITILPDVSGKEDKSNKTQNIRASSQADNDRYPTEKAVSAALETKQNIISNLQAIINGANAGASAVQPGDLAAVALSGSYNDLSGKPNLASVATSGDYNDLINTPSGPAEGTWVGNSEAVGTGNVVTDIDIDADGTPQKVMGTAVLGIEVLNEQGQAEIAPIDANGYVKLGGRFVINNTVIEFSEEVEDVVETVEDLKQDIDTQLVTNFPIANITKISDYGSLLGTKVDAQDGATAYFAFTLPINSNIRIQDPESDETPTVLSIYSTQAYSEPLMFGIFEYDYGTEETEYVADTGKVEITTGGRFDFPLKHKNPNIDQLSSGKLYYIAIHLRPGRGVGGPYLMSNDGINSTDASAINLNPQLMCWTKDDRNHPVIDFTQEDIGFNVQDPNDNYIYGPWYDGGYTHQFYQCPAFFIQLRNSDPTPHPVPPDNPPFIDLSEETITFASDTPTNVFNTADVKLILRAVNPLTNVTITEWTVYDNEQTDAAGYGKRIYDSTFTALTDENTADITLTELGEIGSGTGIYGHKYTYSTGVQLTANERYYFCNGAPGNWSNISNFVQYATPNNLGVLYGSSNPNYVHTSSMTRAENVQLTYLKVKDSDNDEYVI